MTRFGNYLSNAVTPIAESYFQVAPEGYMQSNENYYSIGSYTMPFAGTLHIDMWAEIFWQSGLTAQTWLSVGLNTSPAPSATADMGVCADVPGAFSAAQEPMTRAYWASLAGGQVVTAYARVYTTAPGLVYLRYVGGFWRPWAS